MRRLAIAGAALLTLAAACSFGINPDEGRFSCDTTQDCGKGFECIEQVGSERGLCFPLGTCATDETECDGTDDDCNGAVDDVAWAGNPCVTDLPGACRLGSSRCVDGAALCTPNLPPTAEVCDEEDNDCDGVPDEDFDLTSDEANCGACGVACAAGAECSFALCVEADCANGVDDDGDLQADCEDADCLGRTCDDDAPDNVCGLVPPESLDGGTAGGTDAGSDLDAGVEDAGVAMDGGTEPDDAGTPDAGSPPVPACVPRESACADGVDQDGDGQVDCADPDCDGRSCGDAGVCAQRVCG